MNNTRWRKLRAAMLALGPPSPSYRLLHVEYGDVTSWDGEWFYHFNLPNYAFIEWLEVKAANATLHGALHDALKRLHLPGERTPIGFKIFGYRRGPHGLDYIR